MFTSTTPITDPIHFIFHFFPEEAPISSFRSVCEDAVLLEGEHGIFIRLHVGPGATLKKPASGLMPRSSPFPASSNFIQAMSSPTHHTQTMSYVNMGIVYGFNLVPMAGEERKNEI